MPGSRTGSRRVGAPRLLMGMDTHPHGRYPIQTPWCLYHTDTILAD